MKNYPTAKDVKRKIVITVNSNKTLARIFDDKEVISSGVATCSYEDTFDFKTGVELALARAFEKLEKPVKKEEWKVVKREPKPGDYVRIKKSWFHFDKDTPIVKVHSVDNMVHVRTGDHPNAKVVYSGHPLVNDRYLWHYSMREVEVVEKVEKPKFRKITRVPRPGDYVRIIRSTFYFDTDPNLYIKIRSVSTDGSTVIGFYVNHNDHPLAVKENLKPDGGTWCYLSCMDKFEFYEKVD